MSSEVKRYDAVHIRYEENNIRYGGGLGVEMVTARDYDALHAEAEALRAENAKLRTALAEQGERQEAVVYAVHAKGAQVDHHCPLVSPDMAADYLPGCATPLYTTPPAATSEAQANTSEAAPGVVGLIKALEASDEYLSENRLNEIGSGSILHRQMQDALSAWRQAQVKP